VTIIGDGWDGAADAYKAVRPGTVIFIEGGRRNFRAACRAALESRGLAVTFFEHGAAYKFKIKWKFRRRHLRWKFRRKLLRQLMPVIWRAHRAKGCWIGQVTAAAPDSRSHGARAA
jgi:hypothetical protein